MLTVTEEAVAFLLMAEGAEARNWHVRDYGRPGDPHLAIWREARTPILGTPPLEEHKREVTYFRDRLEAAFFIRQMALKKALQSLFDDPNLPVLLPMATPEDPGDGHPV